MGSDLHFGERIGGSEAGARVLWRGRRGWAWTWPRALGMEGRAGWAATARGWVRQGLVTDP